MTYILGNSAAFLTVAAIVWIAGFVLESSFPLQDLPGDLRQLARICLGLTLWIVTTFALAASGGLYSSVVVAIIALVLVAGAYRWNRARGDPAPSDGVPRAAVRFLPWAGLVVVAAPLFVLAMSPEVGWDANTYHLTLPRVFAARHDFRPLELNVYSNWPLNTELLYTLAILLRDHVLAKLIHFGFGALTIYAMVVLCRGLGEARSGWLAAALFLANPIVVFEMTVAYVDLAHAFFMLAAFVFLIRSRDEGPHTTPCLVLAGVAAGLMAGTKLTGLAGVSILAVVLMLSGPGGRPRALRLRRFGIAYALPALLLAAPWLIRAWWYTGNPIYPWLYSLWGGPDWSEELTRQLQAWQRGIGMGRGVTDYLLLPVRVILQGGVDYDRFAGRIGAFWIVVLPLSMLFVRSRPLVRSALAVGGLYFLFWSVSSQQMRLLIPALPLFAVASAVACAGTIDRLPRPVWRSVARGLAMAAALGLVVWNGSDSLRAGIGRIGRFHSIEGDLRQKAIDPVFKFVNDSLPPEARLLFINTNHGFRCHRDFIADSFFEASQIADWLAPARSVTQARAMLAERGISHLLILDHDWGIEFPRTLYDLLRDPTQVRVLFQSPDRKFTVLELQGAAGRAANP